MPDVHDGNVTRVIVTRDVGSIAFAVPDDDTMCRLVWRLAPLVPSDATWQVEPAHG